jgi:hypothetical protein
MGSIAVVVAWGALGCLAAVTLMFLSNGAIELFRYWTLTVDPNARSVTVSCRTPFGISHQSYSFDDIKSVRLFQRVHSANWLVELTVNDLPIPLGQASRVYAEALAVRLSSLTDARLQEG